MTTHIRSYIHVLYMFVLHVTLYYIKYTHKHATYFSPCVMLNLFSPASVPSEGLIPLDVHRGH